MHAVIHAHRSLQTLLRSPSHSDDVFLLTEVVAEQEQGRQRVRRLLETVVSVEGETALVSIFLPNIHCDLS